MKALMMTSAILAAVLTLLSVMAACGSSDETPATTAPQDNQPRATNAAQATSNEATSAPATPATKPKATTPATTPRPTTTQPATVSRPEPTDPPAPTATPETGGICARQESVRAAILRSLDMTSCSAVTEEHLAAITELEGISVDELSASDVTGLTNLQSMSIQLTTHVFPFIELPTLTTLDLTIDTPDYDISRAEPNKLDSSNPFDSPDYKGTLENFKLTIYPGHLNNISVPYNHLDLMKTGQALRDPDTGNFRPTTFHLINRTEYAGGYLPWGEYRYDRRESSSSRDGFDYKRYGTTVIYEINPLHPEKVEDRYISLQKYSIRNLPNRFVIISHLKDTTLSIDDDSIQLTAGDHIELRGILDLSDTAFKEVFGLKILHLDPDEDGDPHRLYFDHHVPKGSGFLYKYRCSWEEREAGSTECNTWKPAEPE